MGQADEFALELVIPGQEEAPPAADSLELETLRNDLAEADRQLESYREELMEAQRDQAELRSQLEEFRRRQQDLSHKLNESRSSSSQLENLAYRDPLTGLVNQNYIDHFLQSEYPKAMSHQTDLVLMISDLDHFTQTNDRVGFEWGDHLLREIGAELRAQLPQDVLVGRRAEDEFVALFSAPQGRVRAQHLAKQMWEILNKDREAAGQRLLQRASLGIAVAPAFAQSPDELKKQADAALGFAKEAGRYRSQFYAEDLRNRRESERARQAQFYEACVQGRFRTLYQPIVNLTKGRMEGLELSITWEHGEEEFLHLVRKCNLGAYLGDRLLNQACLAAKQLGRSYYVVAPILPGQIQYRDCAHRCMKLVQDHRLAPSQICLQDLVPRSPKRDELLDLMAQWGLGTVYHDVADLLNTADRWPTRKRRFLKIVSKWASQAPLEEPGARISVGLIPGRGGPNPHLRGRSGQFRTSPVLPHGGVPGGLRPLLWPVPPPGGCGYPGQVHHQSLRADHKRTLSGPLGRL